MTAPRIMTVGYARSGTGYGRVLRSLLDCWTADQPDHFFHFDLGGRQTDLPCPGAGAAGPDALAMARECARSWRPDLLFFLGELDIAARLVDFLRAAPLSRPVRLTAYIPLDRKPWADRNLFGRLDYFDLIVAYHETGRTWLLNCFRECQLQPPRLAAVPHGIDVDRFFPLPSTDRVRQRLFPDRPEMKDAFLVLNANRNQPRKCIEKTVAAFAIFARDKPDSVRLYLHMGLCDQGIRVIPTAHRYGIADRLEFTGRQLGHPRVDDEQLNLIYNACDVGLNTSDGEGWGLVAFEHAATGAPQILPGHPALLEIWGDCALFAGTREYTLRDGSTGYTVDPDRVARLLDALYTDTETRRSLGQSGRDHAVRPAGNWKNAALSFLRLFEKELEIH